MSNPATFADFSKANQRKLSPEDRLRAQTEKHPLDTTDAPEPEAAKKATRKADSEKK